MDVRFRPMAKTEEDLALYRAAFERNGSPRTIEHLRWQFLKNPTGRLNVEFALTPDEQRLAAIYAVMSIDLKVGDVVMPACQSLDTLTDVDFRGKGLFVRMAKATFARAADEQNACVYGFPNGNSAHGFFERLGWTRLDPVPFLIKPLRLNYVLRKLPRVGAKLAGLPSIPVSRVQSPSLPGHRELRAVLRFDGAFDELWSEFSAGIPAAINRDAKYLNWRLVEKPNEQYSRVALFENGRLRGFIAWAVKAKHGGSVGYVMELMHAPTEPDVGRVLLQHALAEMKSSGAEVVLAWCFEHAPNYEAFRANGFFTLPERLRPIELHVGVRSLAAPALANLGNRFNWYFSYLDSDTV